MESCQNPGGVRGARSEVPRADGKGDRPATKGPPSTGF